MAFGPLLRTDFLRFERAVSFCRNAFGPNHVLVLPQEMLRSDPEAYFDRLGHFLNLPLFDGTDENGLEDSFIVILDWKPPMQVKWPALSSLPSTKVRLSFFDHQPTAMTPTYEVGMRYWENGVADDMDMDFGDFVMKATMKEFAPQPRHC